MSARALSNWNSAFYSYPAVIADPRDLDELVEVVKDRTKYPSPVRVAGHRHSMSPCFATTGTQLLLRHFNDIRVDLDAGTVTVGANVTMMQIRDAVNRQGMQTEVTPEIGNATAGSVACSGTKDSSLGRSGLGQISSTVIGVKMVNPRGEIETISAEQDSEKMYYVRSSNGLFGAIFEITFSLQKLVLLQYRYASFPLDRLPSREEIFGGADAVLAFMTPYSNRIVVERRFIIPPDARISPFSRLKRKSRDKLWEVGASLLTTLLPFKQFYYVMDRLLVGWLLTLGLLGGFRAQRDDSMIDFKFKRLHYLDFTFWAIPMSRWQEFVPAYVRFCKDYQQRTGFRASLPSEVYFISKDNHSLLSFSAGEDIFTCDAVNTRPNDPLWIEFNKQYNEFASGFGGKPLFTQTKQLSAEIVYKTLGDDWEKMLAQREQYDPEGRFLNAFFRDLMRAG
jgi:FAD binding domain/D-arabinono-1,4-lactone oxidase